MKPRTYSSSAESANRLHKSKAIMFAKDKSDFLLANPHRIGFVHKAATVSIDLTEKSSHRSLCYESFVRVTFPAELLHFFGRAALRPDAPLVERIASQRVPSQQLFAPYAPSRSEEHT